MSRGDYRPYYVAMADDADVQALSHIAFRVLWVLKQTLPASGIGVVYDAMVQARAGGISADEVRAAYAELEAPKGDDARGWIVRERNVVWLVNGLRHTPSLFPNDPKHRTFIRHLVAQVGESRPIVATFKAHYPDWFAADATTPAEGLPRGKEGAGKGHRSTIRDETATARPVTATALRGSEAASLDALPEPAKTAALRWKGRFYREATPERDAEIDTQICGLLTERGVVVERGRRARCYDASHLADLLNAMKVADVKKPDAAIRILLVRAEETHLERRSADLKRDDAGERSPAKPERIEGHPALTQFLPPTKASA